eukprot:7024742-Lingulodinium_polyedra.AAC.1
MKAACIEAYPLAVPAESRVVDLVRSKTVADIDDELVRRKPTTRRITKEPEVFVASHWGPEGHGGVRSQLRRFGHRAPRRQSNPIACRGRV